MRKWWLAAALMLPGAALALPSEMAQEGIIYDAQGVPFEGQHTIRVQLYDGAVGGAALFDESHVGVQFFEGYYSISVGSNVALTPALMARP